MYYDTNLAKFQCYEAGAWKNCITEAVPMKDNILVGGEITDFSTRTANVWYPFRLSATIGDTSLVSGNTITIPETGMYVLSQSGGRQASNTTGAKYVSIRINGNDFATGWSYTSGNSTLLPSATSHYLTKGDTVQFIYQQNAFGNISAPLPKWSIARIGNSNLIDRPDQWTPGTEYNFGDGLYGMRKTGTITSGVAIPIVSTATAVPIDTGGWITMSGNNYFEVNSAYWYSTTSYLNFMLRRGSNSVVGVELYYDGTGSAHTTSATYDVWVKYRK